MGSTKFSAYWTSETEWQLKADTNLQTFWMDGSPAARLSPGLRQHLWGSGPVTVTINPQGDATGVLERGATFEATGCRD